MTASAPPGHFTNVEHIIGMCGDIIVYTEVFKISVKTKNGTDVKVWKEITQRDGSVVKMEIFDLLNKTKNRSVGKRRKESIQLDGSGHRKKKC